MNAADAFVYGLMVAMLVASFRLLGVTDAIRRKRRGKRW
jgi:hypothetical protein